MSLSDIASWVAVAFGAIALAGAAWIAKQSYRKIKPVPSRFREKDGRQFLGFNLCHSLSLGEAARILASVPADLDEVQTADHAARIIYHHLCIYGASSFLDTDTPIEPERLNQAIAAVRHLFDFKSHV